MRVCVSDALAACAMGPAYACALLLLHLNPLAAFRDEGPQPPDAWRAHITLRMLQLMSGEGVRQKAYQNIINTLVEEWKDVLEQTNGAGAALDPAEAARLDGWVTFLWQDLELEKDPFIYKGEHWTHMKTAVENLVTQPGVKWYVNEKGRAELEAVPDTRDVTRLLKFEGTEEWRDVLNAVWAFRIERLIADQPVTSDAIAEKVEYLWSLLDLKKKELSQSPGRDPSYGHEAVIQNISYGGKFQ
jgi:hypothetical protein